MARDSLEAALRARRIAVEGAQRALALALAAEAEVAVAVSKATETIRQETETAVSSTGGDAAVEAFAAWLPRGLAERERARRTLAQAEGTTSQARAALSAARLAEGAVEALVQGRLINERLIAERRSQAALDEMALGRHRDRRRRQQARET
jgi:flagellar export protein FliJ